MTDDAGAKILAKWIGYSWDGLREGRIEGFPQWAKLGNFQGGKQDLRNIVDQIINAYEMEKNQGCTGVVRITIEPSK